MDRSSPADAWKKKKPVGLQYSWFPSEGDKVAAACPGTIYINDLCIITKSSTEYIYSLYCDVEF